jgi:hypothetical protein
MARLPDRFDLWLRQAREKADPARQLDYVLGALCCLPYWHFVNIGTAESPLPGQTRGGELLFVYSDAGRIEELEPEVGIISIPFPAAMTWVLERGSGLLVNHEVVIPFTSLQAYEREWRARGERQASGFWIPNMTTEEEDFWQEHGL